MEEKVKEAFPSEMQATLQEVSHLLGPLDQAEVAELVTQMKKFLEHSVSEISFQFLWEGATSFELIQMYEEIGPELTKEFATCRIVAFRKQYEDGLELGDWSVMADKLYEKTNHLDGVEINLDEWSDRVMLRVEANKSEPGGI